MEYELVIGMEIHVEIDTKSKVFCGCKNEFHAPANSHVCPVCLGMPGALPVMNREMVNKSVAVGLALNCEISRWSKMDRKNYFYPDQSKNYQISQFDLPLCHDGWCEFEVDGVVNKIGITRAHLEEDTARNDHTQGMGESGIDFNRCGVSLLEIVTEPDLRSADQTYAFLNHLKQTLLYLGVSDCNMEEGSLRAEPNISVRPVGQEEFGIKSEVKNVASFSGVQKAIEYEFKRQVKAIKNGEALIQETRGWDADKGITVPQRTKESAHDYRYFPEPDLIPIAVDEAWEQEIRESLPELPLTRKHRTIKQFSLSDYDAGVLTASRAMADYFEACVEAGAPAKLASNWITGDVQAMVSEAKIDLADINISPQQLAAMIGLIEDGTINGKIAKDILPDMFESGKDPKVIVEEKGLVQISDLSEIEGIIREILSQNPGPVEDFRSGKMQAKGFLVGQSMKATKGKANPKVVNQILDQLLNEE